MDTFHEYMHLCLSLCNITIAQKNTFNICGMQRLFTALYIQLTIKTFFLYIYFNKECAAALDGVGAGSIRAFSKCNVVLQFYVL